MTPHSQDTSLRQTLTQAEPILKPGLDRVGTIASGACVAHCALCALAPGLFAVLGISWLAGHTVEWAFTIAAVLVASLAIVSVWRSHRSYLTLSLLSAGTLGLLLSRGLEESGSHALGTVIAFASGAALIAGHLLSIGIRRVGKCEPDGLQGDSLRDEATA